jgi:regulator of protease activity HflC (stomatin/prohibitin superfamily)
MPIVFYLVVVALVAAFLAAALRVLREYERAVMFTLGRFTRVMGPGLMIMVPLIQQMVRVDLRTRVLDVPQQDVISRDNVSVRVNAVVYYRVLQPDRSVIQVEDFDSATSQLAQTTLRSVLGRHDLDAMLAERDKLNADLQRILDERVTGNEKLTQVGSMNLTHRRRWPLHGGGADAEGGGADGVGGLEEARDEHSGSWHG